MAKNLTMANLNREEKVFKEQLDVSVTSVVTGEEYTLKIDKTIRKSKILELITELMTKLQQARDENLNMDAVFVPYCIILMLKHFSSFGKDIPNDLKGQIALLMKLIDLDILEPILESFPEDQAEKVFDQINETITAMNNKIDALAVKLDEVQEEMEEKATHFEDELPWGTEHKSPMMGIE